MLEISIFFMVMMAKMVMMVVVEGGVLTATGDGVAGRHMGVCLSVCLSVLAKTPSVAGIRSYWHIYFGLPELGTSGIEGTAPRLTHAVLSFWRGACQGASRDSLNESFRGTFTW